MEAVILVGIQASGKSTFCRERFFDTHVRINLDMLRTRHREELLIDACLKAKQPFVVDNTNPTRADREGYISKAKAAGFKVTGYYFQSKVEECKERNSKRGEAQSVPLPAVLGTYNRMELPKIEEGFDELFYVRTNGKGGFVVEEWSDEV